jgi:hypothetical protein
MEYSWGPVVVERVPKLNPETVTLYPLPGVRINSK